MNRLKKDKRLRILELYLEGCSIRSIHRMTGTSTFIIGKFLNQLGFLCGNYMDGIFQKMPIRDIQVDELWTFIGKREKNWRPDDPPWQGNVFIWTALDVETRLVFSWHIGRRNALNTDIFLSDLANRVKGPTRITSDSYDVYRQNIHELFPDGLEYFSRIKGEPLAKMWHLEGPNHFRKVNASEYGVHTNYVENHNAMMRRHLKRLQRASGGFSKSVHALSAGLNLYFMFYNFLRIHSSLRVTPAMEAGLSVHVFSYANMLALLEDHEKAVDAARPPRGPYKKRNSDWDSKGWVTQFRRPKRAAVSNSTAMDLDKMITPSEADLGQVYSLHDRKAMK